MVLRKHGDFLSFWVLAAPYTMFTPQTFSFGSVAPIRVVGPIRITLVVALCCVTRVLCLNWGVGTRLHYSRARFAIQAALFECQIHCRSADQRPQMKLVLVSRRLHSSLSDTLPSTPACQQSFHRCIKPPSPTVTSQRNPPPPSKGRQGKGGIGTGQGWGPVGRGDWNPIVCTH